MRNDLSLEAARLERLMRQEERAISRFIRSKVPAADADDVVQDVWLRLWQAMPADAGSTDGHGLVWTLAHRALAQYWRDRGRALPTATLNDTAEAPPDDFLSRALREAVWLALAELPPRQRMMLADRVLLGRSTAELAKRHGLPVGTVKSRLHNGRRRLQDQLRPWYDPSLCAELAASPLRFAWGLGWSATSQIMAAHLVVCPHCREQWDRLTALADLMPEGRVMLRVGVRVEPGGLCWLEGDVRMNPDLPRTVRVGVVSDVGPLQHLVDDRGMNLGPEMRRMAGDEEKPGLYVAWDSGRRPANAARRLRIVHRVDPGQAAAMGLLARSRRATVVSYENVPSYSLTGVSSGVMVALPPGARLLRVVARRADTVEAFGRTWVLGVLAGVAAGQQHRITVHFTR